MVLLKRFTKKNIDLSYKNNSNYIEARKHLGNLLETNQLLIKSCEICSSNNFFNLAERDVYSFKLQTKICKNCGYVFISNKPTLSFYDILYNEYYEKLLNQKTDNKSLEELFLNQVNEGKKIYSLLKENKIDKKIKNIIDVGSGIGGIQFYLKNFFKIKGADYLGLRSKFALKKKLDFIDIKKINNLNEKFDLVIYNHVFEHIFDLNQEIKLIKKLLNKNGYVLIIVPGIKNINMNYNYNFINYLSIPHPRSFSATTLKNFMIKNQFEKIYLDNRVVSLFRYSKNNYSNYKIDNDFFGIILYIIKIEIIYFCLKIYRILKKLSLLKK